MGWGLEHLLVDDREPITVGKWNALVRAMMQNRLSKGFRSRPGSMPGGTTMNLTTFPSWDHPWTVLVSGEFAMVAPGLINGMMPMIKNANTNKITTLDDSSVPLLAIQQFDQAGKGWVALQITADKKTFKLSTSEVVQVANIENNGTIPETRPAFSQGIVGLPPDGLTARFPLAKLVQRDGGSIDAYQVSYFNLQCITKPPSTKSSASPNDITSPLARHFFWAS